MFSRFKRKVVTTDTGIGLAPGSEHYRAYVGPAEDYDLVSAMVFNLLTCAGLRQHHTLLDVGCGSLRLGRLLIPYLNAGHYVGAEPNRWLIEQGITQEIGRDMVAIKRPRFTYAADLKAFKSPLELDYVVAQSIFSHTSLTLMRDWLSELAQHMKPSGALFATFLVSDEDFTGEGWIYPGCVAFRTDTVAALAAEYGFELMMLDWSHPRQRWALFARPEFDRALLEGGTLHWNRVVSQALSRQIP
ncbi:class I SAM-dependent methyltransferase [Aeromonas caviae]|uniref:class I SAM-dependent methyltransferase n=1 Tax=Aeromonas caviae TaxID=648 RepID=UPI002F3F976E